MVNHLKLPCHYCRNMIPVNGGNVWKFRGRRYAAHLECSKVKSQRVTYFHFPSTGNTYHQNIHGRCEDAPCCGCRGAY